METKLYIGADGVHQLLREGGPLICPFGGRVVVPKPPEKTITTMGPPPPMQLEILPMMCSSHCPLFNCGPHTPQENSMLVQLSCAEYAEFLIKEEDIVREDKKTNNLKTIK